MRSWMLSLVFATFAGTAFAGPLSTGDLAFTAFNADEDGWAIVTFVDIDANTTIYFSDNEAISTTGFNAGESHSTWITGAAVIPAGTVVRFSAVDQVNRAASIGSFSSVGDSGLNATTETIYAYLGINATMPTTFLAGISTEGATNLTAAGLTNGTNAVILTNSTDFAEYTGARSGAAAFADYKSLVFDAANWNIVVGGNQSAVEPNVVNFTIVPTTVVPEPATITMVLSSVAALAILRIRKGR
ncbi:MAG: hypothetical protein SFX72_18915 [Isosphaeraceae bacterium]|nr:hypothetical protein [Isosphaeraceae bacterium]